VVRVLVSDDQQLITPCSDRELVALDPGEQP
jgi:hypothetical protein